MKNTIAKKLTVRVALLLLMALVALFAGAYFSVVHMVRNENRHYANAVVGIYADVNTYEAANCSLPINVAYGSEAAFYGDYICSWYRVDYIYMYVPDLENDTIQYIALAKSEKKFGKCTDNHMIGVEKAYKLTKDELAVWNEKQVYAYVNNDSFENAQDTLILLKDTFGNKAMVGVAVSSDDIRKTIHSDLMIVIPIILSVFTALIILMYYLIRKKISAPLKNISKVMTEFITDGKRSDAVLDENGYEEFVIISGAFNSMKNDIDKYLEYIGEINSEQERQKAETEIAANIQKGFLQPGHYSCESCEIYAGMKAAKEIGGDLYDYISLDGKRTLAVIADISGKGMSAAMFMSVTLMLIRQFAEMGQSPAQILKKTNDVLSRKNPRMLFATAFIGIYDSESGELVYANAGHNPPYIIENEITVLDGAMNTLLGLFEDEEYTETSIKLNKGDTLFLYTDGVNEAIDRNNRFFGTQRLEQTLAGAKKAGERDYVGLMYDTISRFADNAEQSDDITMLALTVKKSTELFLDVEESEFSKIKETILSSDIPRSLQLELCVAAEECFVNVCSYAFEGRDKSGEKIQFYFEHSDRIVMRLTDGGIPYDPRENVVSAEDYDIDAQTGGLGKLIAFTVADAVDYEYSDGKNILTITKFFKENGNDGKTDQ